MREDDIITNLESIGLSKNECIVYIDLIRTGKSSTIDISKRTGLHRSNTYDILEKLVKKGIVNQTVENERKTFYPVKPADLLNYHKQKEDEIKGIIPELEKIQNKPRGDIRVSTTEGITPIKNIIMHFLDDGAPIYIHGTSHLIINTLGEAFLNEFHRIRIEKKIPLKRIFHINSINRAKEFSKKEFTEVKCIPTYKSNISTTICKDKVIIIVFETPVTAIVIESKSVADAYTNDFIMLWNEAVDVSKEI